MIDRANAGSVGVSAGRVMATTPISELLQLAQGERLALAMALWDSLEDGGRSDALPVDAALAEELDRRWGAHQQNPSTAVSWEEVGRQLGLE